MSALLRYYGNTFSEVSGEDIFIICDQYNYPGKSWLMRELKILGFFLFTKIFNGPAPMIVCVGCDKDLSVAVFPIGDPQP